MTLMHYATAIIEGQKKLNIQLLCNNFILNPVVQKTTARPTSTRDLFR